MTSLNEADRRIVEEEEDASAGEGAEDAEDIKRACDCGYRFK